MSQTRCNRLSLGQYPSSFCRSSQQRMSSLQVYKVFHGLPFRDGMAAPRSRSSPWRCSSISLFFLSWWLLIRTRTQCSRGRSQETLLLSFVWRVFPRWVPSRSTPRDETSMSWLGGYATWRQTPAFRIWTWFTSAADCWRGESGNTGIATIAQDAGSATDDIVSGIARDRSEAWRVSNWQRAKLHRQLHD